MSKVQASHTRPLYEPCSENCDRLLGSVGLPPSVSNLKCLSLDTSETISRFYGLVSIPATATGIAFTLGGQAYTTSRLAGRERFELSPHRFGDEHATITLATCRNLNCGSGLNRLCVLYRHWLDTLPSANLERVRGLEPRKVCFADRRLDHFAIARIKMVGRRRVALLSFGS